MLKHKMICGRISAWVYKNFEMKNLFLLEQDNLCVLSFNYTDKREAGLFYQYFISGWPLWWYLVICFVCIHIAEF